MTAEAKPVAFYGWRVAGAAFIVAIFGWGLGFYGPPIYLHAVRELRGWSLALVSTAVTAHFLIGAIVVANLPKLYRHFGVSGVTKAGALALGTGATAWAVAQEPSASAPALVTPDTPKWRYSFGRLATTIAPIRKWAVTAVDTSANDHPRSSRTACR